MPTHIVGGRCTYTSYPGTCRIVSIAPAESRDQSPDTRYVGQRVIFTFAPRGTVPEQPLVTDAISRQHELRLASSWYPGPRFLEKYAIRQGAELSCRLDVIVKGTCTPSMIVFDGVDLADYFENER